jgi:[ribosomal protein S5]-alanine N-acetyltransferase
MAVRTGPVLGSRFTVRVEPKAGAADSSIQVFTSTFALRHSHFDIRHSTFPTVLPTLETERLVLRPFREADAEVLHRMWTDPFVRRYLWDNEVISMGRALASVRQSIELAGRSGLGMWTIHPRDGDEPVGFVGFREVPGLAEPEILYGLYAPHCGRGYATEAARAALTYAFRRGGYERVFAGADEPNAASFGVMERLGMQRLKHPFRPNPEAVYYSVRRDRFAPDEHLVVRHE